MGITKREAKALIRYITKLESWTQDQYNTGKYFTPNASSVFRKLLNISEYDMCEDCNAINSTVIRTTVKDKNKDGKEVSKKLCDYCIRDYEQ